jgi:hypothetical protein
LELLTTGPPDSHCLLSGAPSGAALTSARAVRPLFTHCSLLQTTVGAVSCCSAWHTGQSGATPDSLVNYSGGLSHKPEAEEFRVNLPGAPDTFRWHTGQSGGTPGQPSVGFAPFYLNPFLDLFIGLC